MLLLLLLSGGLNLLSKPMRSSYRHHIMKTASLGILEVMVVHANAGGNAP